MGAKLFSTDRAAVVWLAVCATACGTGYPIGAEHAKPLVLVDAERDLQCPQRDIVVEEQWGGVWKAAGCGRTQMYNANCSGVRCEVRRADEGAVPIGDRPLPQ